MDFESSGREGFKEEQMGNKGKLPFSYSSSSSTSSSSHQYKTQMPPPLSGNSRWEPHQFHDGAHPNWLSNRYEPEEDKEPTTTITAATASTEANSTRVDSDSTLELMSTSSAIEKEHMFDKVVTPSDVGKLNRLVIPKQHAEKHFPLDSSSNEKGLLLNFEDRNGKPWRFRYSYWNSSQSYVMTKGWSRFVKDKKLDPGDIVSFQRGVGDLGKDRLFIDWRRRPDAVQEPPRVSFHPLHRSIPWSPMLMPPPQMNPFNRNGYYGGNYHPSGNNVVYLRSAVVSAAPPQMGMGMMQWRRGQHGGGVVEPVAFGSVPVVQGKAAAKRLRLFGVNMDCPISESDTPPLQPHQLSSSQNHQPLQLRLYNGTPLSTTTDYLNHNKGKSSMSLDLDI